jgi:hypothetical protein
MHHMLKLPAILLLLATLFAGPVLAASPGKDHRSRVIVESQKGSAFIMVQVLNHRKIGNVAIELRNEQGRILYKEEGKSMSDELVRRLDKGLFPKGDHTLTVVARDFRITQEFTVD